MKLKSQQSTAIHYPLRKEIAPVLLGVALGMAGCATTPQPKDLPSQTEIEVPGNIAGGITPIALLGPRSTPQGTTCDINTSKPNQIKHPSALAGRIAVPKR